MTDVNRTIVAAHSRNIERFRQTTLTPLTTGERSFVKRRIREELGQIEKLELELCRGNFLAGSAFAEESK